jgi:hypothetical protein
MISELISVPIRYCQVRLTPHLSSPPDLFIYSSDSVYNSSLPLTPWPHPITTLVRNYYSVVSVPLPYGSKDPVLRVIRVWAYILGGLRVDIHQGGVYPLPTASSLTVANPGGFFSVSMQQDGNDVWS